MATITVTCNETTGIITTDVDGVEGRACLDLTAAFEEALGNERNKEKKKEAFVQRVSEVDA